MLTSLSQALGVNHVNTLLGISRESMAGMKTLVVAVAAAVMVGAWYLGLWILMFGGWVAFERYKDGTRKDRIVIRLIVLLVAVFMWAETTFRK